jgi:hypothetical protein
LTRRFFIERALRQIYGGQPTDDSQITVNLVNSWLNDAIATAAKQCYKEAIQLDGIGYVNNGFYSTFKGITVSQDGILKYKITLPQIPVGIGKNEGVSTLQFQNDDGELSLPCIPISQNQATYFESMRPIPNKIIYLPQGEDVLVKTTLLLDTYTATVTMVSGGDDTNLDSTINVPSDYFPLMVDYIKVQLGFERAQPVDAANDGQDATRTT